MSRNQVLIGILALALIALAVFAWRTMGDSTPATVVQPAAPVSSSIPADYARTLGSPKAPITLVEYAAPMCPICAHFDIYEFPRLKAQYIDTGKVYYVFRVFPIGNPDFPAEGIARCLPKEKYFGFIDFLYRNQDKWDPDGNNIPDVGAALVQMAGIGAGVAPDEAQRCMTDPSTIARTSRIAQEASTRYGITGTPSFVIGDKAVFVGEWPFDQLKAELDARLAKKP